MAVTLSAGGYMRSDFMISDAAMPLRIEEIEQSESFQKIFGDLTGKPDISGASDLSAETGIEAEAVPGTEAIDFKGQGAVSDGQTKPELGQNQETEVKIPENPMAKPDTDEFSDGNVMKELAAIMAAQNPQNAIRIQPVAEKQPDQSETVDAAVIPEIAEALENAETPSLETPDIPKILASKLSAANTENVPENEEKSVSVPVDLPKAIGTKSGEGLAVSDITQDDSDDEDIIQKIIAVLIAKKSEEFEKEEKEAGENAVVPKKESETLKRVKATIISMQAEKASKLVSLKSVQEFNLETAAGEGSGVTSHMPSVIDENGEVNKDLLAELQTEAMEMIAEYVSKTGNAVHITQEQLTAAISVNVKASFGSTETNAADLTTAAKKTEEPEIDLAAVMGEITVKEVTPKEQTGNQDSGTSQNGQNPEPNSAESMKTSS